MSLDEVRNIRIIAMDAQGKKQLIGRVTAKESGKSSTYMNQIDSLSPRDIVWLSDRQDDQKYITGIEFSGGNQIRINFNIQQHGSPSINDIIQTGQTVIRLYIHFERK